MYFCMNHEKTFIMRIFSVSSVLSAVKFYRVYGWESVIRNAEKIDSFESASKKHV